MSKHHVQSSVLHDVHIMTIEQLEEAYGIEVLTDGVVWDKVSYQTYDNIYAWADDFAASEEEECYTQCKKMVNNRRPSDDDYR